MLRRKQEPWWNTEFGLKTQGELKTKIQAICNNPSNLNNPLSDQDTEFLVKVLKLHHEFSYKIGTGIKHLEIRVNQKPGMKPTKGIWIERTDHTSINISWTHALFPGGKPTTKEDVCKAERFEVMEQIHECSKMDVDICELCKLPIHKQHEEIDVDHIQLFDSLFISFLSTVNLSYPDIIINDLGIDSRFIDRSLASKWIRFHKEFAKLRLVHHICNLKRTKK